MYIKNAIILILLLNTLNLFSQIKISDVSNYKQKVDSALSLIKKHDRVKYNTVVKYCKNIDYIIGNSSTTYLPSTIVINTKDLKLNSVTNISSIIVHESYHLLIYNERLDVDPKLEEFRAYNYELDFLNQLPVVEPWIIRHVEKMIEVYR